LSAAFIASRAAASLTSASSRLRAFLTPGVSPSPFFSPRLSAFSIAARSAATALAC